MTLSDTQQHSTVKTGGSAPWSSHKQEDLGKTSSRVHACVRHFQSVLYLILRDGMPAK